MVVNGHPTLSKKSQAAIADGKNLVFVSAVVVWQIRLRKIRNILNTKNKVLALLNLPKTCYMFVL